MARDDSAPIGASWAALRDQTIADLDNLMHVTDEARDDLLTYRDVLEKNRAHLLQGGRVSETPALFDIRSVRTALSDGLNQVERARNDARLSLWRLQLAEGTSIAEIARIWGFSRQLVSRALAAKPDL